MLNYVITRPRLGGTLKIRKRVKFTSDFISRVIRLCSKLASSPYSKNNKFTVSLLVVFILVATLLNYNNGNKRPCSFSSTGVMQVKRHWTKSKRFCTMEYRIRDYNIRERVGGNIIIEHVVRKLCWLCSNKKHRVIRRSAFLS